MSGNLTRRVSVRMSEGEVARLEEMAVRMRRSLSDVVRIMVDAGLTMKWYNDVQAERSISEGTDGIAKLS